MNEADLKEIVRIFERGLKKCKRIGSIADSVKDPITELAGIIADWATNKRIGTIPAFLKALDRQICLVLIKAGLRSREIGELYGVNAAAARSIIHVRGLTISGKTSKRVPKLTKRPSVQG